MPNGTAPSGFNAITQGPIANKDGTASTGMLQLLRDWNTRLTNGLNLVGQLIGIINAATIVQGRSEGIGTTLRNISTGGAIVTDNLTDGTGSPLAGGTTAHQALTASGPAPNEALIFNGTDWQPGQVAYDDLTGAPTPAQNTPRAAHEWLDSFNDASGVFGQSQPEFADISGQLASSQLPVAGVSATVTLAQLTTGGTQGSLTITNGIITAVVNPT